MRRAQYEAYGPARSVLGVVDVSVPEPEPDELLVRVHASSVNPIDCALRRGYGRAYFESRGMAGLPMCPGRDVSGEVIEAGSTSAPFATGDRVYGAVLFGGNAEYARLPVAAAAHKPASLSHQEAAALPFAALTAWTALVRVAGLTEATTPGKRIVVPRAVGGVGSVAMQLIKAWGGHVTALCSPANAPLARELGADDVVDYENAKAPGRLQDFDVAFDTAFGTESLLLGALREGADACYVTVVSPRLKLVDEHGLERGLGLGEELLAERVREQAAHGRRYHWVFAEWDRRALEEIARLVDAGEVRPMLDAVFSLEDIVAAHERCESGAARGRVGLSVYNPQER